MAAGVPLIQNGTTKPMNKAFPIMNWFLIEFRLTYCKGLRPTPTNKPNKQMKFPPITGSGMVINKAPNLPITAKRIIKIAPNCMTRLLPT